MQKTKQNDENERARKTLEVALKQLIPDYPENFEDTKQVYDYLIKPDVKLEINKKHENMKQNFVKIKDVRSIDKSNKKSVLLTYLILKHLFFYEGEEIGIDNLETTMDKYKATMKQIQNDFKDSKKHQEDNKNDIENIKVIYNFVNNVKTDYPYNKEYTTNLNIIKDKTGANKNLHKDSTAAYHGFSYIPNERDIGQSIYNKSFNGLFNTYVF